MSQKGWFRLTFFLFLYFGTCLNPFATNDRELFWMESSVGILKGACVLGGWVDGMVFAQYDGAVYILLIVI